jgi:myo-inositol-1(or 4)-monophosphatase
MHRDEKRHYLQLALATTEAAGAVICSYYQSAYDAWDKKPDNPITTADLAADTLLRERLTAATPGFGWLSEETRDTRERLDRRYVWVVDPLDGTKEFIEGLDQFAISVALVGDHQPLLGVVHNPATRETFAAMVDGGPVGERVTYNGAPAGPLSSRTEARGAQVLASNTEVRRGKWDPYLDLFDVVEMGSAAYKLGRIAAGLSDAYISLNPKNEWDICGGGALILAAGGRVTDLHGEPLRFNQERTLVNGVVAANPALHAALIELLASPQ